VLDRSHRTAEACADMDTVLGEEIVRWMAECVKEMRSILRVKMEAGASKHPLLSST